MTENGKILVSVQSRISAPIIKVKDLIKRLDAYSNKYCGLLPLHDVIIQFTPCTGSCCFSRIRKRFAKGELPLCGFHFRTI